MWKGVSGVALIPSIIRCDTLDADGAIRLLRRSGGKVDDEDRTSFLGGEMDGAAILLDNAMDDSESKPCANAHRFGRIEIGRAHV